MKLAAVLASGAACWFCCASCPVAPTICSFRYRAAASWSSSSSSSNINQQNPDQLGLLARRTGSRGDGRAGWAVSMQDSIRRQMPRLERCMHGKAMLPNASSNCLSHLASPPAACAGGCCRCCRRRAPAGTASPRPCRALSTCSRFRAGPTQVKSRSSSSSKLQLKFTGRHYSSSGAAGGGRAAPAAALIGRRGCCERPSHTPNSSATARQAHREDEAGRE
jgi:hypothetical protein